MQVRRKARASLAATIPRFNKIFSSLEKFDEVGLFTDAPHRDDVQGIISSSGSGRLANHGRFNVHLTTNRAQTRQFTVHGYRHPPLTYHMYDPNQPIWLVRGHDKRFYPLECATQPGGTDNGGGETGGRFANPASDTASLTVDVRAPANTVDFATDQYHWLLTPVIRSPIRSLLRQHATWRSNGSRRAWP